MKILFLNPPHKFRISRSSRWPENTKSGTLYYPYWLAYAAGLLLKNNNEVLLLDAIAEDLGFKETMKKIKKFDPKLLVVEISTPTFFSDIKFLRDLKSQTNTKICVVGTHASVFPKDTLEKSKADFVAVKEYDYTVLELSKSIEGNKRLGSVKGIYYKNGEKISFSGHREPPKNLDDLPFVSKIYKKFLNLRNYRYSLAKYPMVQIWSARGCPYRCTFCQYPQTFSGHKFRARSPEDFVSELEWIEKNLPQVKEVFVEDDTMTVDKRRILKICNLIREKSIDITWSANLRADVPYNVLKEMKKSGFRMAIVGYESGNQRILNNINKGITKERAIKFTRDAKKVGIKLFGCFMVGLPGENKETIKETLNYAKKINPDMAFFQQAVPFPGTAFYKWVKESGYLTGNEWSDWLDETGRLKTLIEYPNLSAEEIKRIRDVMTKKFYLSPKWILQNILSNLTPSEAVRMLDAAKNYMEFLLENR